MMSQEFPARQFLRERLEFLEFRLWWEGLVNRHDLMVRFGISEPQASADLQRYRDLSKGAMEYDSSSKAYVPTRAFRPVLVPESSEAYLGQLLLMETGATPGSWAWISTAPSFAIAPRGRKPVPTSVLRALLAAIRTKSQIEIRYQSSSGPEPLWRSIAPHALAYDGIRWHVRAWCFTHDDFRDFVIARTLDTGRQSPSLITTSLDAEWNTFVTLDLVPHPGLHPDRKRVVELDYNMSSGHAWLNTRACLVRYIEWQLRLERPTHAEPEWDMQVVLANRDEVLEKCRAARELTAHRMRAAHE